METNIDNIIKYAYVQLLIVSYFLNTLLVELEDYINLISKIIEITETCMIYI